MDIKHLEDIIRKSVTLELLGIRIEDMKDANKHHIYFSVPERTTIDSADEELNNKINTADGLKLFVKEEMTRMMLSVIPEEDQWLIEDIDMSDYVKFYAKIRKGEVWTQEDCDKRAKEIADEIEKVNAYKGV